MNQEILNEITKQDYNSIKNRIEKFLVNEVNQSGSKGVIFGLSGGIDSAEVMVLEGATKTLQITKNLILEIHSRKNAKECLKILKEHGFHVEIIRKSSIKHSIPYNVIQEMENDQGQVLYYPLILAKK